jgi:hypothetical protein
MMLKFDGVSLSHLTPWGYIGGQLSHKSGESHKWLKFNRLKFSKLRKKWANGEIHASILLKADRPCGWSNEDSASAYEVSTKKVEQLKKRFVEEGFEAALSRKPGTNVHRRKITGDAEAHVIALYWSQAPEGHERWP